jgi:hypothetical protein
VAALPVRRQQVEGGELGVRRQAGEDLTKRGGGPGGDHRGDRCRVAADGEETADPAGSAGVLLPQAAHSQRRDRHRHQTGVQAGEEALVEIQAGHRRDEHPVAR